MTCSVDVLPKLLLRPTCLRVELQDDALIGLIFEAQVHLVSVRALFCFDGKSLYLSITPFDSALHSASTSARAAEGAVKPSGECPCKAVCHVDIRDAIRTVPVRPPAADAVEQGLAVSGATQPQELLPCNMLLPWSIMQSDHFVKPAGASRLLVLHRLDKEQCMICRHVWSQTCRLLS